MTYPFGLPLTWTTAQLGEVCEITQGQSPPGTSYNQLGKGPPFLQGKTEFGAMFPTPVKWCSMPSKFAQMGDVLISVRAPVGSTNMANARYCIGRGLAALRPLGGISNRYIFYGIRATVEQLTSNATGTTFPAITGTVLHRHTIPLPPLAEQHRIVEEIEKQFTRLDAAVEALRTAQAKLKRYRASVLNAAVTGRLVPTEAALACTEGRDYEPASVLLERIARERAEQERAKPRRKRPELAPVDTSNLPELPEGWTWTALGGPFSVYVGSTPPRSRPEYWAGDVPWVTSGEVQFVRIQETKEQVTQTAVKERHLVIHPVGSVLLGMIGEGKTRGQSAILGIPATHNQNAASLHVSETSIPPEYVFHYLMANYENTRTRGSGGNQPALNKQRVSNIPFPVAPLGEMERIVAEIGRLLSTYSASELAIETNLKRAERLRQAILKRAFMGRLVPQDPDDEPAAVLLERIKTEKAAAAQQRPRRGRKAATGRSA